MSRRAPAGVVQAPARGRQPARGTPARPGPRNAIAAAYDEFDGPEVEALVQPRGDPAANDESPAPADFSGVATHAARAGIFDDDAARARLTLLLLQALAPRLGLDPSRIVVRADAAARAPLDAVGAAGLQRDGTLLLHPGHYRPERDSGRYLFAHELAHAAQRFGTGSPAPATAVEADAHRMARALVRQQAVPRPATALAPGAAAALSASEVERAADVAAALPQDEPLAPQDARTALDDLVAQTHQAELARIIDLLSYGVFDWAVTDSDVTAALRVLMTLSMVGARSLVSVLPGKYRHRLLANLDTVHYKAQREQVLAAWWGCAPGELRPFSDELRKAFEAMDLRRLGPLEATAAQYALDAMEDPQRRALLGGPRRDEIEMLAAYVPDPRDEAREMDSTLTEERALHAGQAAAAAAFDDARRGPPLKKLVKLIIDLVDGAEFGGEQALSVLKMLMPWVLKPVELRAIADHLAGVKTIAADDPKERPEFEERRDYLEEVIVRVPIQALYASGGLERVFFLLLSFRPASKNAELADATSDSSRFILVSLLMKVLVDPFVDRVTSEDAYLAFLLVKAMPPHARRAFFDVDDGARWTLVMKKMSQQQRESESLNLFGGGQADAARDAILSQLLADAAWKPASAGRLDALIRMAVAAGEHAFVFGLSEQRAAHAKPWLKAIVNKYRLYDPQAEAADGRPRTHYRRDLLKGTPWYTGGSLIGGVYAAAQGLDFVFSSDNVEVATKSIGGRGLNLVELQDLFGGNFMGARFARRESFARGKGGEPDRGTNFANVKWDTRLGLLTLSAPDLEIEAIRYPIDDFVLQTGTTRVRGLELALAYGTDKRPEPTRIDLAIQSLTIDDMALVAAEKMKSVNQVAIGDLEVHAAAPGSGATSPQRPRAGLKVPVPLVGIPLGGAWNLFLGSMWNSLAGLVGAHPKTGVSASADEMADQLLAAKLPMGFKLTLGSVRLTGVATSGGQFIESIALDDLVIQGGGDADSYRKALAQSQSRIEERLARLRGQFGSSSDREAMARRIRGLEQQLRHTRDELAASTTHEAEVRRLEALQKTAPRSVTAADRLRLRQLKAQLSGAVLDVGHVSLKGLAGWSEGTFELDDVHGSGRSVDHALGLLSDSDKLRSFVTGAAGRPVLKQGANDPSEFVLDIGHAELPGFQVPGNVPDAVQATRDYQKFKARHDPWRPSHVQELARLEERRHLAAQRDALLADPGVSRLDAGQQKLFRDTGRRLEALEAQAALSVGRVVLDGASATFSGASGIAVRADRLDIAGLRQGAFGVGRIEGTNVEVGVDIRDGIAGFDEWRRNLQRINLRGENVTAYAITQEDLGLSVDKATLMGIDEASVDLPKGAARVTTRLVLVEGARLRSSEEMLHRERDYLQALPRPLGEVQGRRLDKVQGTLDALAALRQGVADSEADVIRGRTPRQREAAGKRRDAARHELDRWAEGLVAGTLSIDKLDIDVFGLSDVLSPGYDPQAAGLGVQGRGGASKRRLFTGATGTRLGIPGLSAGQVTLGEAGGAARLTPSGTLIDGLMLDSIELDRLDWRSGREHVFAVGPVTLQSVAVKALIGEDQIAISSLEIGAITASQVGYENESTGLRVVVESGGLGSVRATNLTISNTVTQDPVTRAKKNKTTVLGDVRVGSVADLKLDALVAGLRARGTLNGGGLHAEFVTDRRRVFSIDSLGLGAGVVTEPGTTSAIHVSFKGLGGRVTQETLDTGAVQYQLDDVVLADFDLGQCRWSGSGWVIQVDGDASLKGVTMTATALQAAPGPDGKAGKLQHFTIGDLRVAQVKAHQLRYHKDAVPADPKKRGDTGSAAQEDTLESATILGLEVRGIDLMKDSGKMTGKVTVHDSIDIGKLRRAVGEAGKEQIVTTLSTKVYGKEASDAGLRGRELSAQLFGPRGSKIQIGTVKEISGDFEGFGAKTGFTTGKVTMSPIDYDGVAKEAHVTEVNLQDLQLNSPTWSDGKGTTIKAATARVPKFTLKDVRAKFGELTDTAGKKSTGLTLLTIAGVELDFLRVGTFDYEGVATLATGGTRRRHLTAASAELAGLSLEKVTRDFAEKVTRLENARLKKTTLTSFGLTLAQTLGGHATQTEVGADIEAGEISSKALTLTDAKSLGEEWTSLDGLFELTDPDQGLGLTNVVFKQLEGSGGKLEPTFLLSSAGGKTGGLDLKGLKVHLAPNGTIYFGFDELTGRTLHMEAGGAKIDLDFAALRKAAVSLTGQAPGQVFDVLGATLKELEVKGATVTYEVDRSAAPTAGGAKGKPDPWKLDALSGLSGTLRMKAANVDWVGDVSLPVPISGGVIDFDKVSGDDGKWPPGDIWFFIDERSIWARQLKIPVTLYAPDSGTIPGVTPARIVNISSNQTDKQDIEVITSRGQWDFRTFLETTLNAPPSGKTGAPAKQLDALNTLSGGGALAVGDDVIGTTRNNVVLSGSAAGKNAISISSAHIGSKLDIALPELQASRGQFEMLGHAGETGTVTANVTIGVAGLGDAADAAGHFKFTITLTLIQGAVRDIRFGDVALATPAAARARPAPPQDKKP